MTKCTIPADMPAAQAEADALRARVAELEAAMIHMAAIRPQYSYITADSLPLEANKWEPGSPYDRGLRDAYNQINALANRYLAASREDKA